MGHFDGQVVNLVAWSEFAIAMDRTCQNCSFFETGGSSCDPKGSIMAKWGICRKNEVRAKRAKGQPAGGRFVWDYETCCDFKAEHEVIAGE
jgi:hypothetical protein